MAPSRELTYGPETSAEHDAESAVVELLSGLAVRSPDVPLALMRSCDRGGPAFDPMDTTFFASRDRKSVV